MSKNKRIRAPESGSSSGDRPDALEDMLRHAEGEANEVLAPFGGKFPESFPQGCNQYDEAQAKYATWVLNGVAALRKDLADAAANRMMVPYEVIGLQGVALGMWWINMRLQLAEEYQNRFMPMELERQARLAEVTAQAKAQRVQHQREAKLMYDKLRKDHPNHNAEACLRRVANHFKVKSTRTIRRWINSARTGK